MALWSLVPPDVTFFSQQLMGYFTFVNSVLFIVIFDLFFNVEPWVTQNIYSVHHQTRNTHPVFFVTRTETQSLSFFFFKCISRFHLTAVVTGLQYQIYSNKQYLDEGRHMNNSFQVALLAFPFVGKIKRCFFLCFPWLRSTSFLHWAV